MKNEEEIFYMFSAISDIFTDSRQCSTKKERIIKLKKLSPEGLIKEFPVYWGCALKLNYHPHTTRNEVSIKEI